MPAPFSTAELLPAMTQFSNSALDHSTSTTSRRRVVHLPTPSRMPGWFSEPLPTARFAWEEFVYASDSQRGRTSNGRRSPCGGSSRAPPPHVGRYLDEQRLRSDHEEGHLAALRHFFDKLVLRHVVASLNPALSVRSETLRTVEGKTACPLL